MSRAFWLATVAFAIVMLGTTLPTPLYPIYERQFGIAPLLVPVIFAVYAVAVALSLAFFGRLSDDAGRRPVLFAGLAFSAASAVVFLLAHSLPALYAGRVLSGFSAGVFTGTATAALIELASADRRQLAAMIAVAANIGGLGLGTLLCGLLAAHAPEPLRLPYAVDLALIAVAAVGLWAVPETVRASHERWRLHLPKLYVPANVRGLFWNAAIAGMCSFAVSGLFSAIVPLFLARQVHDSDPALAGIVVFVLFAFTALGQISVPRVSHDRALSVACAVLIAGTAILAAAIVWASLTLTLVAAVVEGAGQGLAIGAGLAAISERAGERRGQVASTYFVVLYVALALPVVGVGVLAETWNFDSAALLFCAVVVAATASVWMRLALARRSAMREDSHRASQSGERTLR